MIAAMADDGLAPSWARCLGQIRRITSMRVCPCTRTTGVAAAFGLPTGRPLNSCALCRGAGVTT
jgi:hypothetical protein